MRVGRAALLRKGWWVQGGSGRLGSAMPQQEHEAAVQEFLEGLGRGDCTARVVAALPELTSDASTWVLELQAMELEEELDAFLDACEACADGSTQECDRSDSRGEKLAAGSSSEPVTSVRNADDEEESIEAAVERAAEVALENGSVAEEMFTMSGSVKGKKTPREMQLKVGQMSLQLLHGGTLLNSWMYPDLGGWEFAADKTDQDTGTFMLRMGPNRKKGDEDLEFVCSGEVGSRCCVLMEQHAKVLHEHHQRKKREEAEKTLRALRGDYTVSRQCLLLRESAALDSPKIGIVESGEAVTVVDAVIVDGRTRVHVVGDGLKMRSSSDSQLTSIDGWGSWKTNNGVKLLYERLPRQSPSAALKGVSRGKSGMHDCLGEYTVEQAGGVVVRATEDLESDELCMVATGETVQAVEGKFVGERLRLRITSDSVNLVAEHGNPERSGPVAGWVSLRDAAGTSLLKKLGAAEAARQTHGHTDGERGSSEASDSESSTGAENESDDGDEFHTDATLPVVPALVLQGSIQDQIDDALSATCQDLDAINLVLERANAKSYRHPSLTSLQMKATSLNGQPSASSQRRMSVAQEGVHSVVDLASQAAAASGNVGERIFHVSIPQSGKKPAHHIQLKVSQMGVQTFDGPQVLDSWLYKTLGAWEFKAGKQLLVLVIASNQASASPKARAAGSKRKTVEFGCTPPDGAEICKLMTDHAMAMAKQQRSEVREQLQTLRGMYTVTTPKGVLVRGHASPDSFKIGIVATDEEFEVVDAVLNGDRYRLHAVSNSVHMDDGTRQQLDGWISLKNANGVALVAKTDSLVDGTTFPKRQAASPPKPARRQSLRRHSVAIGTGTFSRPASSQDKDQYSQQLNNSSIVEVHVKQAHIEQAPERVLLRCDPMALRVMDGARCVSSITYSTLLEWQTLSSAAPNAPRNLQLTFIDAGTVAFQCLRHGDAEKISLAMTKCTEKLVESRSPKASQKSRKAGQFSLKQPERPRARTAGAAQGLAPKRRASVAVGMEVPRGRKAFIKNSAFMPKTDDGKGSFVAKQKTPRLCDVTLLLHNFGLQVSVHLSGERPVTYTYDRIVSWKVLPNGDLLLKILSPGGDLEIFTFATRDAQRICDLLSQFSGAEPKTPTALEQEQEAVVEPGDRFECVESCALTAEWERNSDQTGLVAVGCVIEVAEATINIQKQWRLKISRAWNDSTCTALIPSLEGGWASLKKVDGVPNFLLFGGEQKEAAQSSSVGVEENETAFWRETRLLEEATQRVKDVHHFGGSAQAVVEPIRMSKKMRKASKNLVPRPSENSDTTAVPSIPDSQELEDPVSPSFLQDAASAVAAADDWLADEKVRLQEQHALQLAEQQRKIAALELQIVNLTTSTRNDATKGSQSISDVSSGIQTELATAKRQAASAARDKEQIETEKVELEKRAGEQLAEICALEEQIKLLVSQVKSDGPCPDGSAVVTETALDVAQRAAETRAELAESKLANIEQEKNELQLVVYEQQAQLQSVAKLQNAQQLAHTGRVAELEANCTVNERCQQALSEELDRATAAMNILHEKLLHLTVARDAAVNQAGVLEQQNEHFEKCLADQEHQILEFESQKYELEHLRLHYQKQTNQSELVQKLRATISILEAKVGDELEVQLALRRENAELKIQAQTAQSAQRHSSGGKLAADETARMELKVLHLKVHDSAVENETLRTDLARTKRLVAETEIRETKAVAQVAEAHRHSGLLTQELQTTKDELHAHRTAVSELKDQVTRLETTAAVDDREAMLHQELETLRAEHTGVQEKLEKEMTLREKLKRENTELRHDISAAQEARKRLEAESRAGWDKADAEADLRKDAMDDQRTKANELQAKVDELTRALKKQQTLLATATQQHEDAQRKLNSETERSHAAELNAQHVASRARAASAEMRSNMIDIQSKYEKQLAAIRADKAKIEVARDQAVQERESLQEWLHEHMTATQERLLNSSAAVEAAEKVRVELQPRLEKSDSELRRLKDQLRRVTRESASAQQQAASQFEHLKSERSRLEVRVADLSSKLEEQRTRTAVERDRREASDRRMEAGVEAVRVAERNAADAIRDAKAELGTALERVELEITRRSREEMELLRLTNSKLEGQVEHSVRSCNCTWRCYDCAG